MVDGDVIFQRRLSRRPQTAEVITCFTRRPRRQNTLATACGQQTFRHPTGPLTGHVVTSFSVMRETKPAVGLASVPQVDRCLHFHFTETAFYQFLLKAKYVLNSKILYRLDKFWFLKTHKRTHLWSPVILITFLYESVSAIHLPWTGTELGF